MYNEKYQLTFIHYQILEEFNLNLNLDLGPPYVGRWPPLRKSI
jgi:hypothetical protein